MLGTIPLDRMRSVLSQLNEAQAHIQRHYLSAPYVDNLRRINGRQMRNCFPAPVKRADIQFGVKQDRQHLQVMARLIWKIAVAPLTHKSPFPALFRIPNVRHSFIGSRPTCRAAGMAKIGTKPSFTPRGLKDGFQQKQTVQRCTDTIID